MPDVMIIQRTGSLLRTQSEHDLTFDSEDLILYRTRSFTKKTQVNLTELVHTAQLVAFNSFTANALVGLSNEGSDTGDVGIWLGKGDYGRGKEENILKTLGLPESWLQTVGCYQFE
jgi:molybdopterin/thiamine biosynthesis adenylyltransferase